MINSPIPASPIDSAVEMTPESDVEVAAVDVAELAARLRLSSTRLARRLRQEAEIGLSPSMLSALAVIAERGPLTLGSLAEIEAVAPPTVTKVVQRLEAAGLVDRITDPEDRRVRYVECTGLGSELLRTSRERKNAWLANKLETFSDEERATLSSALDVLETLSARSPESARDPE